MSVHLWLGNGSPCHSNKSLVTWSFTNSNELELTAAGPMVQTHTFRRQLSRHIKPIQKTHREIAFPSRLLTSSAAFFFFILARCELPFVDHSLNLIGRFLSMTAEPPLHNQAHPARKSVFQNAGTIAKQKWWVAVLHQQPV